MVIRDCVQCKINQAWSHAIQSRSSVNRVYDSKVWRSAEDNRTESNCMHWKIQSRGN